MKRRTLSAALAIIFLLGTLVTPALAGDGEVLVRIRLADPAADVVRLAAAPLTPLARESAPQDYVLARAGKDGVDWLGANGLNFEVLDTEVSNARYLMIDLTGPKTGAPEGRLLFADGQRALWRVEANAELPSGHNAWFIDQPIRLLPRPLAPLPNSITPLPIVQEIINQVDLTRLMFNTNELSGQQATTINGQPYTIATRNTLSGTPVNQSVAYMVERLQRLGLAVTTHSWNASPTAQCDRRETGPEPVSRHRHHLRPPGRHAQQRLGARRRRQRQWLDRRAAGRRDPFAVQLRCHLALHPVHRRRAGACSAARRTPTWCRARISAVCSTWT